MLERLLVIALGAALTGCTLNVIDKRLEREEVAAAFSQRDKAIEALADAIKSFQEKANIEDKRKK